LVVKKSMGVAGTFRASIEASLDSEPMSAIHAPISSPRLTREDVLSGREVADLLDLPVSTVLEYARRGLLPGHKLGRRWIFLRDEVEATVRGKAKVG
jgi:excisionase family DNA binding protein